MQYDKIFYIKHEGLDKNTWHLKKKSESCFVDESIYSYGKKCFTNIAVIQH